jgi:hypothetical protein
MFVAGYEKGKSSGIHTCRVTATEASLALEYPFGGTPGL